MAIPVRLLTINLGTARVRVTEDSSVDGIYTDGQLVSTSPTQGRVGSEAFPFDPRNLVLFSAKRDVREADEKGLIKETGQLLPVLLYRRLLPADATVRLRLFLNDVDGFRQLSPEELVEVRKQTGILRDEFIRRVEAAVDNQVLRSLIIFGIRLVTADGAVDAIADFFDPPDVLGEDFRVFDVAREPAGTRRFTLKATMDDADYDWSYSRTLSPVMEVPDGTDLNDPDVIPEMIGGMPPAGGTPVPVPPTGGNGTQPQPPGDDGGTTPGGGGDTTPGDGGATTPGDGKPQPFPPAEVPGGGRVPGGRLVQPVGLATLARDLLAARRGVRTEQFSS